MGRVAAQRRIVWNNRIRGVQAQVSRPAPPSHLYLPGAVKSHTEDYQLIPPTLVLRYA